MSIAFPASPTVGQVYTFNNLEFTFTNTGWRYTKRDRAVAMTSGVVDLSKGEIQTLTVSAPTTISVTNASAAGLVASFILELTNGGSAAVTWFAGLKWANGTPPSLTAAGTDVLGFYTRDGGVTWRGFVLAANSK